MHSMIACASPVCWCQPQPAFKCPSPNWHVAALVVLALFDYDSSSQCMIGRLLAHIVPRVRTGFLVLCCRSRDVAVVSYSAADGSSRGGLQQMSASAALGPAAAVSGSSVAVLTEDQQQLCVLASPGRCRQSYQICRVCTLLNSHEGVLQRALCKKGRRAPARLLVCGCSTAEQRLRRPCSGDGTRRPLLLCFCPLSHLSAAYCCRNW
jgi:hypothetical protein